MHGVKGLQDSTRAGVPNSLTPHLPLGLLSLSGTKISFPPWEQDQASTWICPSYGDLDGGS